MEDHFSGLLKSNEQDPVDTLIDNEKKIFGRFNWIDAIVSTYPAYTHDDVFYFEYDFAMMLLRMMKMDVEYNRKRDKLIQKQRK